MWFKKIFIPVFVLFAATGTVFAQETPPVRDSTHLYEKIDSFSKKSKFTGFLYRQVFKPIEKRSTKKKPYKKLIKKTYRAFEGKIIRNIRIETLDPFGYITADTSVGPQNFIFTTGNKLHIKTQPITIRNLILIKENQPFDSLLVKESERLIRSQGYVQDVSLVVKLTSEKSDSVDIVIRELDNWSLIPVVGASLTHVSIQLTDKNFLGLGHEFKIAYGWNTTNGDDAYGVSYFIPNIRNTYINTTVIYRTDEVHNFIKSISVDRPFFSPYARWAGGVHLMQQLRKDSVRSADSSKILQRYKFNIQDYWAGVSTPVFKGNTEFFRSTSFFSTGRFMRMNFLERPVETLDTFQLYSSENLYLASVGISIRRYVQDKYIFNFGLTEDVPIGKMLSLTGGYREKNNTGHLYLGARVSLGDYYSWGYLSSSIEYGTFFRMLHAEQGVFSARVNYFTGLFEIRKWTFRQFVKSQITIGINRFSYEKLTLNDEYGIDGFNSPVLSGNSRLLITLQTQAYTPWNLLGFHFGPFFNYSIGMLSTASGGFKNSGVYSQIGLGVLIKNYYLFISTFQISVSYYPSIPGHGQNVVLFNSLNTTDFGFSDFGVGEPGIVNYH